MQIQKNPAWVSRLASFRFQIGIGTFAVLFVIFIMAGVSFFSLKKMQKLNRDSLQISESLDHLYLIDRKISDDSNLTKLRSNANEFLNDDLIKTGIHSEILKDIRSLLDHAPIDVTVLRTKFKELITFQQKLILKKHSEIDSLFQFSVMVFLGFSLLISFSIIAFSRKLSRSIIIPVQQMLLSAERLSLGDLAPRVEENSYNELGDLARVFNQMSAKMSERQLATLSRNRELDELYYFHTMLQTSESEIEVHRALLQKVKSYHLSQALIYDWDSHHSFLRVVATLYPLPEKKSDGTVHSYQIPMCRVVRAGREIVLHDLSEDLICNDCHFGQQRGSAFCVPIISSGKPIGALHLISPELDYWNIERQKFVKALVDQAASAVNNLRNMELLRGRALMDEQTQVHNRRYLDDYLRKQLAVAERQQRPLCVMMLDIDHFKRFNDTYGHESGDIVLRQFAQAIKSALREGELIARYGGEEFTVIMHGTAREALTLAERLRRAIAALSFKQFTNNGEEVRITMSIGIAEFPTSGTSLEQVLKAADLALYQAKDSGRNCVRVATRTMLAVRAAR